MYSMRVQPVSRLKSRIMWERLKKTREARASMEKSAAGFSQIRRIRERTAALGQAAVRGTASPDSAALLR